MKVTLPTGVNVDVTPTSHIMRDPQSYEQLVHLTGFNLDRVALEMAERHNPALLARFYPRVYAAAGQYNSPKVLAAYLTEVTHSLIYMGVNEAPTSYQILCPALRPLAEHKMPTYFLGRDFLEAVKRTTFAGDIDWTTLELPFEEGVLVLPRGALVSEKEGEVGFIVWSRKRPGSHPPVTPELPTINTSRTSFSLLALCPNQGVWVDSTLSSDKRSVLKLNNLFYREKGDPVPTNRSTLSYVDSSTGKVNRFDTPVDESDAPLLELLGVITFGTFLALNARPELLERGQLETVAKNKSTGTRREFWSPNVIGRRYTFKQEPGGGTHASPRLHWRRGHFRNQACGIGRKEHRTIWLEPVLIGAQNA